MRNLDSCNLAKSCKLINSNTKFLDKISYNEYTENGNSVSEQWDECMQNEIRKLETTMTAAFRVVVYIIYC